MSWCEDNAPYGPTVAPPRESPEDEQFLKVFYADGKFIGIPMSRLRALLATQGLMVIDAASAKVLEACSKAQIGKFCDDGRMHLDMDDDGDVAEAELARRGRKEET